MERACGSASDSDGAAIKAKLLRDRLHSLEAEGNVFIQVDAQVSGAGNDVVAIDFAGECFVFHSFSYRPDIDFG